jgi:SAM-dependent methyltransferase
MTDTFQQALREIVGGRVLDVATRRGGFVRILAENLSSYAEIVGIDTSEEALESAQQSLYQDGIHFACMDASRMGFEEGSFDTVAISASLHHLTDNAPVLNEMKRVLRKGGSLIVAEMHRDGQTEAQLTFVYLHHWVAAVDTALGNLHNRTLSRREIIDQVEALGLHHVRFHDSSDSDGDPMDEARIERLDGLIDRTIQRARAVPVYEELKRQGDELRQRLHDVGAQREPGIIIVGEKR